jgi:thiamine transport system permease protein
MGRNIQVSMKKILSPGFAVYPGYLLLLCVPFVFLFRDFFSTDSFLSLFSESRIFRIAGFTAWQAFVSALVSFLIALLPALYCARSRGILSSVLSSTIFIPFFFPAVSCVAAFSILFSKAGIFAHFGFNPGVLYSFKGVILAHAFYNSPIFVKYLSEAIRAVPHELIDEVKVNGASSLKVFIFVELPLILPACARAFFLVYTFSFSSFAVILGIGGMSYATMEVEIAAVMRSTLDFSRALSLALVQYIIIAVLSFGTSLFHSYELSSSEDKRVRAVPSLSFFAVLYCIFEFGIVGVALGASVFDYRAGVFDLSPFINIFSESFNERFSVIRSLIDSAVIASLGSAAAVAIAFVLAKRGTRFSRAVIYSGVGVSSAFLAIALLYMHILSGFAAWIFVCAGYILIAVPIVFSFLQYHLSVFNKSYGEECRVMGGSRLQMFRYVEFPLLMPVIVSAFLQAFALLAGEFTLAYTMQINDAVPLASITVFSLDSARFLREGAALSAILLLFIGFLCFASNLIVRRKSLI